MIDIDDIQIRQPGITPLEPGIYAQVFILLIELYICVTEQLLVKGHLKTWVDVYNGRGGLLIGKNDVIIIYFQQGKKIGLQSISHGSLRR